MTALEGVEGKGVKVTEERRQNILGKVAILRERTLECRKQSPKLDSIVLCLPKRDRTTPTRRLWNRSGPSGNVCGSDQTREFVWFKCQDVLDALEKVKAELG